MIKNILEVVKPKRKILILTHNNPDPDTIASAFALKNLLFEILKKRCTIAYHGIIGRAENRELIRSCSIDMYQSMKLSFSRYDCLIVVDTQPTAGNVYIPEGFFPEVVIDHHNFRIPTTNAKVYDIRIEYGSTSTIITEYYKLLGITPDINTATALYYGIKTDTTGTGRMNNKVDLAMMSYVLPLVSMKKFSKIESPELPKYTFRNIKKSIENAKIMGDVLFCNLGETRNADLIAEAADLLLRMRDVKWSFIIGKIDNMCYFSLRCKLMKRKVGFIALSIVKGIGTGGGHMKSAGGQIPLNGLNYDEVVAIVKERLLSKIGVISPEEKSI